jgi:hypothetical protein
MKHLLLLAAFIVLGFPVLAQAPTGPPQRAQQRADSTRAALKRQVGHSIPPSQRRVAPLGRPSRRKKTAIVGHLL